MAGRQSTDWSTIAWVLLIGMATSLVYGSSLRFFFSQDDFVFLARATHIVSWGDLVRSFAAPDHFYRPVPRVVLFLAQLRLFGLNAAAFHLVNLGLHATNAILLFLLCRRLFASTLLAGLAGLLFATHHVPFLAVYWVSGIQDLCVTGLLLASLHFYLHSVDAPNGLWRVFSLVAYGLALLSKEIAVTFPLLLVLVSIISRRHADRRPNSKHLAWHVLGYAALAGLYLAIRSQETASLIATQGPYAWSFAPRTVLGNLYTYFCDALYARDWLSTEPMRAMMACTLFLAAIAIVFWRSPRSRWVIAMGIGWFVIALLPVLFLSQRAYSYYAYFPLAGMAMVLATPIDALLKKTRHAGLSADLPWHVVRLAGILVLLIAWLWFSGNQVRATETKDPAGIIAKSILAHQAVEKVREIYPALPQSSTLYVVGLTESEVWAFGQGDLFRLYYPQAQVHLLLEGQESQIANVEPGSTYVYRFGQSQ